MSGVELSGVEMSNSVVDYAYHNVISFRRPRSIDTLICIMSNEHALIRRIHYYDITTLKQCTCIKNVWIVV